jgi:hypothetical protein
MPTVAPRTSAADISLHKERSVLQREDRGDGLVDAAEGQSHAQHPSR